MTPSELGDLYAELTSSRFSFIPRGEHHLQDILREVQARFPQFCDDSMLCKQICTEGNESPEWHHRVRAALQELKSETGPIIKGKKHGYWSFARMADLEKARHLFQDAGLAFPTIPKELAAQLKEAGKWLFSTRELKMSPYFLQHYVEEGDDAPVPYVVLGHSGHDINSYAIQYYLVSGPLRLFLHLGWGGVYTDADAAASKIRECFALADEIVPAAMPAENLAAGERVTIVGSDSYGSYWSAREQRRQKERADNKDPVEVLTEVLHWLKNPPPNNALRQSGGT